MNNNHDIPQINEGEIHAILEKYKNPKDSQIREILSKGRELSGLNNQDIAILSNISDPELLDELFSTARYAKETIYGRRLVFFSPLYVSNLCGNECTYCAFRAKNTSLKRRCLTQNEIQREVKTLVDQGHKRVLLVAGESYPTEGFSYILDCIDTIYATNTDKGNIRRINVNVAPLTDEEFRLLKNTNIGTYQLFQETYHRPTYAQVHIGGKKRDYDWRISALSRAMKAKIDDVGIGVLFGLYDWRYETLAMMEHVRHLEHQFGVGPHTISVPRLEPATGSEISEHPPYCVSDIDFKKLVAILRLAVPYTGIIMSTRETAQMRRETFALGVSQISAGSRTNPGGYSVDVQEDDGSQFSLGDHRHLNDVIYDIVSMGYIPSFCTGCYRLGRTGKDFMDLAKPGDIKMHCDPNALSTFQEYLIDFANNNTRQVGETLIKTALQEMPQTIRQRSDTLIKQVLDGKRDVYC